MGSKVGHPSHGPAASSALPPVPSSPADRPTVEFGEGWGEEAGAVGSGRISSWP
jgi:hypothetical protein